MAGIESTSGRVLLIYPAGATAQGMADGLARKDVTVERVDNVFKAISSFTSRPADLVVLGLADIDDRDLEVIRVLRELEPNVYLVLAFPAAHRDRAVKALSMGADGYILEPFYLGEFLDMVRRGLARARPRSEGISGFERLAGAVAHAINNPLQILELLMAEGSPDPADFRLETNRVKGVVRELLAYSRRDEVRAAPLDLNAVVREAFAEVKAAVRLDLDPDLPGMSGDPRALGRAIGVIGGLARARGSEGPLTITTDGSDGDKDRLTLRVRASELLLSAEELETLFRPFCGPIAGAVGLAAATADSVIRSHGGSMTVESLEGEGTSVTIRLPIRPPDEGVVP